MTLSECKSELVDAHRRGDMDRAVQLSQVKQKLKKEARKHCHCGRAKHPDAIECGMCYHMGRKKRMLAHAA